MNLKAVIFDLDGVLTDTAENHYLAWKKLADEEGLTFGREENEKLRGVSRRDSLLLILGDRQVDEADLQAMMARKNSYYREMLSQISPADLLPGVPALLDELDAARFPYGLASASKNAPDVITRLGIADRLQVIADGNSVERQKPAPDLFLFVATKIGFPPANCLVVEDAEAGVAAAVAAGMPALAIGPEERFNRFLTGSNRVTRRDNLQGLTLAKLEAIVTGIPS